jgi:hypothetical protein
MKNEATTLSRAELSRVVGTGIRQWWCEQSCIHNYRGCRRQLTSSGTHESIAEEVCGDVYYRCLESCQYYTI